ncbi:cbb3-type cytochrome c oxidase subunit II, partial [Campylobacter jejuni]|nr:cbb3-type cytochrome c oxidase subunit II [Campylobacter jejuni]
LARVGNYRTADWHENHMWDPTSVVPDSIMPSYKHMFKNNADIETAYAEALTVKKVFNVPYDAENGTKLGSWEDAQAEVKAEAQAIVDQMKNQEVKDAFAKGEIKEIVALIAYLNSLK